MAAYDPYGFESDQELADSDDDLLDMEQENLPVGPGVMVAAVNDPFTHKWPNIANAWSATSMVSSPPITDISSVLLQRH